MKSKEKYDHHNDHKVHNDHNDHHHLQNWHRFQKWNLAVKSLDIGFDFSKMQFEDEDLKGLFPQIELAFQAMKSLESGDISNPDEGRRVGHYWLRNADLAPEKKITNEVLECLSDIKTFAQKVDSNSIKGSKGPFKNLLIIGIGGSALGPQFLAKALGEFGKSRKRNKDHKAHYDHQNHKDHKDHKVHYDHLSLFFLDNTDPDGIEESLSELENRLGETLILIVSKSGNTAETRNGMLETRRAFHAAGLTFSKHAVAITSIGSRLDRLAKKEGWLKTFPMWDWVGGRTSLFSAVGLLPAALQGIDIDRLLFGAKKMDEATRVCKANRNPAAMMALLWFISGNGKGDKNMIILPYKDRLELLSKYLQQLIMESIGKGKTRTGEEVHQGISVFGNKGSTDQHAYIQQLFEGRNDFFVTFIQVLKTRSEDALMIDSAEADDFTGDTLFGFLLGTQRALSEKKRESMTITIPEINPESVGGLIAVFERAVGFYASLIGINAYHQPAVEAGKKAANEVIDLQKRILNLLKNNLQTPFSADQIAHELRDESGDEDVEMVWKICEHLSANRPFISSNCPSGNRLQASYLCVST